MHTVIIVLLIPNELLAIWILFHHVNTFIYLFEYFFQKYNQIIIVRKYNLTIKKFACK